MIKGIQAVTFDFFNTLVYHRRGDAGRGAMLMAYLASHAIASDPWEHQVLYDVMEPHAREYSPDFPPAEKHAYFCQLAGRVFRRLNVSTEHQPADHAAAIWNLIGPGSLALFPEVLPTLDRLRSAGYRLAIISNWQCGLHHFCVELGLADRFEHVLSSAEVGCAKPDAQIFADACQRLGVEPGRVLHVGDTQLDDVDGAQAYGMQPILIDRKGHGSASISSLDGVLEILGYADRT